MWSGVFCQSAIDSAQNDHANVVQSMLANKEAATQDLDGCVCLGLNMKPSHTHIDSQHNNNNNNDKNNDNDSNNNH